MFSLVTLAAMMAFAAVYALLAAMMTERGPALRQALGGTPLTGQAHSGIVASRRLSRA